MTTIKARARSGDQNALETMFRQFIPPDEAIDYVAFLGLKGFFGLGRHSFAAVTERRVASLELSMFGGAKYVDGYHEHFNGSALYQPSRLPKYVASVIAGLAWISILAGLMSAGFGAFTIIAVLAWCGVGVAALPLIAYVFYRFVKSGLVLVVREGFLVYCFADRSRLGVASELASRATEMKDQRSGRAKSPPNRATSFGQPTPQRAETYSTVEPPENAMRKAVEGLANEDILKWLLGLAMLRLVGVFTPYQESTSLWDDQAKWQWVLPALCCGVSAALAIFLATEQQQLWSSIATGAAAVIALQTLLMIGVDLKIGTTDVQIGFWMFLLSGIGLSAFAVVSLMRLGKGKLEVRPRSIDAMFSQPINKWLAFGGLASTIGAAMPWYGDGIFWGLSSQYNVLFVVFFGASALSCLLVTSMVLNSASRSLSTALLAGWSAALAGWALGIELTFDELLKGFRLFEIGTAVLLAVAIFNLSGQGRSVEARQTTSPPFPPPAV